MVKILANVLKRQIPVYLFPSLMFYKQVPVGLFHNAFPKIIEKKNLLMKTITLFVIFTFSAEKSLGKLCQVVSAALDCPCNAM